MEPAAAVVVFSSGCGMAAARLHTVHDVPHMKRVAKILLGVLGVLILLIVAFWLILIYFGWIALWWPPIAMPVSPA